MSSFTECEDGSPPNPVFYDVHTDAITEAYKITDEEKRATIKDLCVNITARVNEGDMVGAVELLKAHDELQERWAQDTIALDTCADAYCSVVSRNESEHNNSPEIPPATPRDSNPQEAPQANVSHVTKKTRKRRSPKFCCLR